MKPRAVATLRDHAQDIFKNALEAVDPEEAVRRFMRREAERLTIHGIEVNLADIERSYVVGCGKAAIPMASAVEEILGDHITDGTINIKSGSAGSLALGQRLILGLKFGGVPVRWELEITDWRPPRRFVDRQRRGPFLFWEHEHMFSPEGKHTRVEDVVRFAVPGFILEPFVYYGLVRGRLRRQFDFREDKILQIFSPSSAS